MKDDSEPQSKPATTSNGNGNGVEKPVKKGRVGAIVDAEKKARRRSSLGGTISLPIPQVPGQFAKSMLNAG